MQKPLTYSNGCVRVERQLAHDIEGSVREFFRAKLGAEACKPPAKPERIKERILEDAHFSSHVTPTLKLGSLITVPSAKGIYAIDGGSFDWLETNFPLEDERSAFMGGFWHRIHRVFPPQNYRAISIPFDEAAADSGAKAGGMQICAFSRALATGRLSCLDYAILSQLAYQRYWESYLVSGAVRYALGKDGEKGYGYAPFPFNIISFEHEWRGRQETTLVLHDAYLGFLGDPHAFYIKSFDPRFGLFLGSGKIFDSVEYYIGADMLNLYSSLAHIESIRNSDIDAAAMELLKKRGFHSISLMA